MPGCFLAFEGTEGSGKSTQLRRAAAWLAPTLDVVVTREPGGTPTAERIRELVLGIDEADRDPATDALLMSAARRDHCTRVIRPALDRGAVVLTDRFAASTRAYQGAGDGVDAGWLAKLEALATGGLTPDRVILLDVEVEVGLHRRRGEGGLNAIDERDAAFHRRVGDGYRAMAAACPDRWAVIDAGRAPDDVWDKVRAALADALGRCGVEVPPS